MDQEEWARIAALPAYEISSFGRVRRATPYRSTEVGRILKPFLLKGYPTVRVRLRGRRITIRIHQEVARAFVGARPEGYQVNHKDLDKTNNQSSNLEYVTPSENIRHAARMGAIDVAARTEKLRAAATAMRKKSGGCYVPIARRPWGERNGARKFPERLPRGSNHANAVLDERRVAEIKGRLRCGETNKDIAAIYGVSQGTISNIKREKVWRHVPWPN